MWPDWEIYWTLGNFLNPLAAINLPKSTTFLGNFCKDVIFMVFLPSEIVFGQLLLTFGDFFWSHCLSPYPKLTLIQFLSRLWWRRSRRWLWRGRSRGRRRWSGQSWRLVSVPTRWDFRLSYVNDFTLFLPENHAYLGISVTRLCNFHFLGDILKSLAMNQYPNIASCSDWFCGQPYKGFTIVPKCDTSIVLTEYRI